MDDDDDGGDRSDGKQLHRSLVLCTIPCLTCGIFQNDELWQTSCGKQATHYLLYS